MCSPKLEYNIKTYNTVPKNRFGRLKGKSLFMNETVIKKCADHKYHPHNVMQISVLLKKAYCNELKLNLEDVDISKLDSLDGLFRYYDNLFLQKINIQAISRWDVSHIKTMKELFYLCDDFDGRPVECWNVSNVTDLESAFEGCTKFNADLSSWKLLSLTNMGCCFKDCFCFEGKGLQYWNLPKVTNLSEAFKSCKCFDADVGNFSLDECSDLSSTFEGCLNFNGIGVERWNCSKLRSLNSTFKNCYVFNPDLSNLDVRSVEDFSECFFNCFSFEGKGLCKWHNLAAVSFNSMFENAFNFNADLQNWCFKATEADFCDMFNCCFNFEGKGLSAWKLPKKANFTHMFYQCQSVHDEDLSNFYGSEERCIEGLFSCIGPYALGEWLRDFKVQGTDSLSELFCNTNITGEYLKDWDVGAVTDFSNMFNHCMMLDDRFLKKWKVSAAEELYKTFYHSSITSEGLEKWDTSNVKSLYKTFGDCRNFTGKGLINWNVETVTDMDYCFCRSALNDQYLKNWNTKSLKSFRFTFHNCNGNRKDRHGVTGEGLIGFNFSNGTNGECTFAKCRKLKSIYLRQHHFEKLRNAFLMFSECISLTGEGFEQLTLSKLEDATLMFYGCTTLKSRFFESLTLKNLKNGQGFFAGCSTFTGEGLDRLSLNKLKNMQCFFYNCVSLNSAYLKNLALPKVEKISGAFANCKEICDEDFCSLNLPVLKQMAGTFYNCPNVTGRGVLTWNLVKVEDTDRAFACCDGISEKTAIKLVDKLSERCDKKSMFYGCCNLKNTSALPKTVLTKGAKIKPLTKKALRFYYEEISFEDF